MKPILSAALTTIIIITFAYLIINPKENSLEHYKGSVIINKHSDFFTDNEVKIETDGQMKTIRVSNKLFNKYNKGDTIK